MDMLGPTAVGFEEEIRNPEGERVLEFAVANNLVVVNTRYIERPFHLETYCSGNHKTQIDYILYRKSFSNVVSDVKVIPIEECVQQHHLVVCYFKIRLPKTKKRKFTPPIRIWKLRNMEVADAYHTGYHLQGKYISF
jgi:hypothetical protein